MAVFFVYIIGLLGTLVLSVGAVAYLVVALMDRRAGPLHLPLGMLCGFVSGPLFIWTLVPRDWPLSFWTTLAASVDAARYGHVLEHSAEGIVIWILFSAVVCAVVGGFIAHTATKLLERRRAAPAR